jgi:hypothetical protein
MTTSRSGARIDLRVWAGPVPCNTPVDVHVDVHTDVHMPGHRIDHALWRLLRARRFRAVKVGGAEAFDESSAVP